MKKNLITGLVLASFALICGFLLSLVNSFTSKRIEARNLETIKESIAVVCNEYGSNKENFDLDESVVHPEQSEVKSTYLVKEKATGDIKYVIYIVDAQGYASTIEMMIAVDKDHKVAGYTVISSAETKGDITIHDFNMDNKSTLDGFEKLAGSSISSKAVRKCFNIALYLSYQDIKTEE